MRDVSNDPSSTAGASNATTERTKPANTSIANTTTANDDSSLLSKIRISRGIQATALGSLLGILSGKTSENSTVSSDSNTTIENFIDSFLSSANETYKSAFGDSITRFLSEFDNEKFTVLSEANTTIGNLTVSLFLLGNETFGIANAFGGSIVKIVSESNSENLPEAKHILLLSSGEKTLEGFAEAIGDFIEGLNTPTEETTTAKNDDDDNSILSMISTPEGM